MKKKWNLKEKFNKKYWKGVLFSSLIIIGGFPLVQLFLQNSYSVESLFIIPLSFVGTFTLSAPVVLISEDD